MSKVTSKLQVTLPKAIAVQYNIKPGDEVHFSPAGDVVRLELAGKRALDVKTRLDLFDQVTARQRDREATLTLPSAAERGWSREELYQRGGSR